MEKYTPDKRFRTMSREEVRRVDAWAIEEIGLPGAVLMENAGRSCAELIRDQLAGRQDARVCCFCGVGNNGGDGYVIARHLRNAGIDAPVVLCGPREKVSGDARMNLDVLERLSHPVEELHPGNDDVNERVQALASDAQIVVDALFGTGLKGQVREPYPPLIEAINGLGRPILAVDIPSGLDCDTGEPLGVSIRATWTVTFVAVKKGFLASAEADRYTGELYIASIGVEPPPAMAAPSPE